MNVLLIEVCQRVTFNSGHYRKYWELIDDSWTDTWWLKEEHAFMGEEVQVLHGLEPFLEFLDAKRCALMLLEQCEKIAWK